MAIDYKHFLSNLAVGKITVCQSVELQWSVTNPWLSVYDRRVTSL